MAMSWDEVETLLVGKYRQHYAVKAATLEDRLRRLDDEEDGLESRWPGPGAADVRADRRREIAAERAQARREARDGAQRRDEADKDPAMMGFRKADLSDAMWMGDWGSLYAGAIAAGRARDLGALQEAEDYPADRRRAGYPPTASGPG